MLASPTGTGSPKTADGVPDGEHLVNIEKPQLSARLPWYVWKPQPRAAP
jgi:hypothetical protein